MRTNIFRKNSLLSSNLSYTDDVASGSVHHSRYDYSLGQNVLSLMLHRWRRSRRNSPIFGSNERCYN